MICQLGIQRTVCRSHTGRARLVNGASQPTLTSSTGQGRTSQVLVDGGVQRATDVRGDDKDGFGAQCFMCVRDGN